MPRVELHQYSRYFLLIVLTNCGSGPQAVKAMEARVVDVHQSASNLHQTALRVSNQGRLSALQQLYDQNLELQEKVRLAKLQLLVLSKEINKGVNTTEL